MISTMSPSASRRVAGAVEQQLVVHGEVEHGVVELILEAGDPDVEGLDEVARWSRAAPVKVRVSLGPTRSVAGSRTVITFAQEQEHASELWLRHFAAPELSALGSSQSFGDVVEARQHRVELRAIDLLAGVLARR